MCIRDSRAEALASKDTELLLVSLDHFYRAGESAQMVSSTLENIGAIETFGVPAIGLAALERIDSLQLREEDRSRLAGATARLLLGAGDYTRAMQNPLKGLLLPQMSTRPSEVEIDAALSFVDSTYRADPMIDREALMSFTISVAELDYISRPTRVRAADIGLVMASNECDAISAERVFVAADISLPEINADEYFGRTAILYHTLFGDPSLAYQIANKLFERSRISAATSISYQDALRAGFSLRVIADGQLHLLALEHAFEIAQHLAAPTLGLNAAWLLSQSYLELGETTRFRHWYSQVNRLFEQVAEPIVCNYAVGLFCRAAIEERSQPKARAHLEVFSRNLPRRPALKTSSYALSLQMAVELLDPEWQPPVELVSALLVRQDRIGRFGTCDFLTSIAAESLARVGRIHEAIALIRRYVGTQRRETCSLGVRLAKTSEALERE